MLKTFKISGTTKEIYFVCVTFLAYCFCGINRAYLAFLFHQLDFSESLIPLHDEQKSYLAAFSSLLSPLGCLISGICMDLIGRRRTLLLIYIPFIISWAMITYAESVDMLYIAFLCQGTGSGMTFCSLTYISEICTAKYRGSLLVILLINYNFGVSISNYMMYLLPWNMAALIFTGAAVFILMLTYFLPESPTWLYLKGKKERSIKTLCYIRSKKTSDLECEIADLEKYCSSKEKTTLKKTFINCINAWRQFFTIILLLIFAASCGHMIMPIFGIMIMNRLNMPYESHHIMIMYSTVGMLTCFLTPYLFQKFARKKILAVSSLGMCACALVIGLYEEFQENFHTYAWIVPAVLFMYSFIANLGVGPIAFSCPGELLPNESRGVLSGLCGSVGFLYFSSLQKIFPGFLSNFGVIVTMYTFSTFCLVLTLYAIFIFPETRGKTLNQIQEEYFNKKKVHNST